MSLHVFRSVNAARLYGVTIDPTGANLPLEDGPWESAGDLLRLDQGAGLASSTLGSDIVRQGYALLPEDAVHTVKSKDADGAQRTA